MPPEVAAPPPTWNERWVREFDRRCNAFESAWRATLKGGGPPPRIEDCLANAADEQATELFRELMALEVFYRGKSGAVISRQEDLQRFPKFSSQLQAAYVDNDPQATVEPGAIALDPSVAGVVASAVPALGGYEVLGELGKGGMGVVYKARHLTLGHLVALKFMRGVSGDGDAARRFLDEAKVVARLRHPHIVQVYDYVWNAAAREWVRQLRGDGAHAPSRVCRRAIAAPGVARFGRGA